MLKAASLASLSVALLAGAQGASPAPSAPSPNAVRDAGPGACWPGQAWVGHCVGTPAACPSGFRLDVSAQTCTAATCEAGEQETDGHCCWPGQTWQDGCSGVPRACPAGFVVSGVSCVSTAPQCVVRPAKSQSAENFDPLLGEMKDGGGTSLPDQLYLGDIMTDVAGHKKDIVQCIREQKGADDESSGTVTMHWLIRSDGSVADVAACKMTAPAERMAACMTRLIATWRFGWFSGPPMPIDFPFKF